MSLRNILLLTLAATAAIANPTPASKSGGSSKNGGNHKSGDSHKNGGSSKSGGSSKGSNNHKHGGSSGSRGSHTAPSVPAGTGSTHGTTGGGTNTDLHTTFPTPKGSKNLAAVKMIAAGQAFDGGMMVWDRSPSTCRGQKEGGDKDAVFILEEGSTISNAIIGPNNGEGIHCLGSCTINNVWFQDVCEDAITFKQKSGTSYVNGGGAQKAKDKVLQHNGGGTVAVKNFFCKECSKLYRSCGNCLTQTSRKSTFENVRLDGGKVLSGVNSNYGDTAVIKDSCVLGGAVVCELFKGNNNQAEPKVISKGPDGKVCIAMNVKTRGC